MPTQPSLNPHISTALQTLNYAAPVDLQYEQSPLPSQLLEECWMALASLQGEKAEVQLQI